jgi:hypothetical protein
MNLNFKFYYFFTFVSWFVQCLHGNLGDIWNGFRFQFQCGAIVYNINLIIFKNILNINNK